MANTDTDTKGFKVPFAQTDEGKIIDVHSAVRGESYKCPGCKTEVRLRSGKKYRPHFFHLNADNCSGEGVIHKVAKNMLGTFTKLKYITKRVRTFYSRSDKWTADGGLSQDSFKKLYLSSEIIDDVKEIKFREVLVEGRDGVISVNGSKYRADLKFITEDGLVGYIEVVHHHRTDVEKMKYYQDNGIFVIDVYIDTEVKDENELLKSLCDHTKNWMVSCQDMMLVKRLEGHVETYAKELHDIRNKKEQVEKEYKEKIKASKKEKTQTELVPIHSKQAIDMYNELDVAWSKVRELEKVNWRLYEEVEHWKQEANIALFMLNTDESNEEE